MPSPCTAACRRLLSDQHTQLAAVLAYGVRAAYLLFALAAAPLQASTAPPAGTGQRSGHAFLWWRTPSLRPQCLPAGPCRWCCCITAYSAPGRTLAPSRQAGGVRPRVRCMVYEPAWGCTRGRACICGPWLVRTLPPCRLSLPPLRCLPGGCGAAWLAVLHHHLCCPDGRLPAGAPGAYRSLPEPSLCHSCTPSDEQPMPCPRWDLHATGPTLHLPCLQAPSVWAPLQLLGPPLAVRLHSSCRERSAWPQQGGSRQAGQAAKACCSYSWACCWQRGAWPRPSCAWQADSAEERCQHPEARAHQAGQADSLQDCPPSACSLLPCATNKLRVVTA